MLWDHHTDNNQLRKSKTRKKNPNESPYMAQNQNKKIEIRDNYTSSYPAKERKIVLLVFSVINETNGHT